MSTIVNLGPIGDCIRGNPFPGWHKRPTGPGYWFCWGDDQEHRLIAFGTLLKLDAAAITEGAPYRTACVYGPIPEPPKEMLSEKPKP